MTFTEEQYKQIIKDIKEGVVYNGDMMRWNGGPLFDPSEIISRLIEENTRLRTDLDAYNKEKP